MISFRMLSLPMFALVAALAGCTAEQGTTVRPDTASTAQQAAQGEGESAPGEGHGHHGPRGPHHGPGGPDFLIGAALHAPIDLNPSQRATIEGLMGGHGDARGDRPEHRERPPFDATKAKELATAIRSGNVASLPPPPVLDGPKMQAHLAESAAKIKALHDTLTAAQRAKLVADIEAHAAKAGGPHGGPKPAVRVQFHGPHGPGGEMFGSDLDLTDAQKEQLKAKFEANHPKPDLEAMRTEMKEKLESFKADNFDAAAFVTPSAKMPKPSGNPLADLVSVLTPEQREILAKKIETGPQR